MANADMVAVVVHPGTGYGRGFPEKHFGRYAKNIAGLLKLEIADLCSRGSAHSGVNAGGEKTWHVPRERFDAWARIFGNDLADFLAVQEPHQ